MSLTQKDRRTLYFIAFVKPPAKERMPPDFEVAKQPLLDQGFVEVRDGHIVATIAGLEVLSPMAHRALQRPENYWELPPRAQWAVDESLGILDWDGC